MPPKSVWDDVPEVPKGKSKLTLVSKRTGKAKEIEEEEPKQAKPSQVKKEKIPLAEVNEEEEVEEPVKKKPLQPPKASLPPKNEEIEEEETEPKSRPKSKGNGLIGRVREEFVEVLHGKTFVTYPGLLDLAHSEGLKSIVTQLVQYPNKENDLTAIVAASVTIINKQGVEQIFMGIGDANPDNVKQQVRQHLIRIAETRAKARALRDATNIGVAAIEELGGDEEDTQTARRKR